MTRPGADYETVKHTAVKLLSQGTAPSAQKIREVLGTGSNTTIAERLRVWRDEYAKKTIHHLPANMPKGLISTFEVLWQTAMEQAQNQLIEFKKVIENEHEAMLQAQRDTEKVATDLKEKITVLTTNLGDEVTAKQKMSVELAVVTDQLQKQDEAFTTQKNQYETRLKRIYSEKDNMIEQTHRLQNEIKILQEKLTLQAEENKRLLTQQNVLQEQSEIRWLKLIDQARQETKEERKKIKTLRHNSEEQIKKNELKLTNAQKNMYEKDVQLKIALDQIVLLKKEAKELQNENKKTKSMIASLENKRQSKIIKRSVS